MKFSYFRLLLVFNFEHESVMQTKACTTLSCSNDSSQQACSTGYQPLSSARGTKTASHSPSSTSHPSARHCTHKYSKQGMQQRPVSEHIIAAVESRCVSVSGLQKCG